MIDIDGDRYELHRMPTGNLIVAPEFGGTGTVVKEREPGQLVIRLNRQGYKARRMA